MTDLLSLAGPLLSAASDPLFWKGLEYAGSASTAIGASWLAANIPSSRYGYAVMTPGSFLLPAVSLHAGLEGLGFQQVVFIVINLIGMARWLVSPPPAAESAQGQPKAN